MQPNAPSHCSASNWVSGWEDSALATGEHKVGDRKRQTITIAAAVMVTSLGFTSGLRADPLERVCLSLKRILHFGSSWRIRAA